MRSTLQKLHRSQRQNLMYRQCNGAVCIMHLDSEHGLLQPVGQLS